METIGQKPTRFFFDNPNLSEPDRNKLIGTGKWWLSRLKLMQESDVATNIWEKTLDDGIVIRIDTSGDIDNVKIDTSAVVNKELKTEPETSIKITTETKILPCLELVKQDGTHNGFLVMDEDFNPLIRCPRDETILYDELDAVSRNTPNQPFNGYVGIDAPDGEYKIGNIKYIISSLNSNNKRLTNNYEDYVFTDTTTDLEDVYYTGGYWWNYPALWTNTGDPECPDLHSGSILQYQETTSLDEYYYARICKSIIIDMDEEEDYIGFEVVESPEQSVDVNYSKEFYWHGYPYPYNHSCYREKIEDRFNAKECMTQDYGGDGGCWENNYYLYCRTQRDKYSLSDILGFSGTGFSGNPWPCHVNPLPYIEQYPPLQDWINWGYWADNNLPSVFTIDMGSVEETDVYHHYLNISGELIDMFPNGTYSGVEQEYWNYFNGCTNRFYNAEKGMPAYCFSYIYVETRDALDLYNYPSLRFWFRCNDLMIGIFGEDDIIWKSNGANTYSDIHRTDNGGWIFDVQYRNGDNMYENGSKLMTYGYMRAVQVKTLE